MNDVPREKLERIVAEHGPSICDDAERVRNLLNDHCPEYRREIHVLFLAASDKVPAELLNTPAGFPIDSVIAKAAQRLQDTRAVSEDAAY